MNAAGDLTHAIAGYRLIEELYRGSRTLVYRAIREADEQPVVIKLLHRDYPSFSELLQFRNQYTIAKNLRLPSVVTPYTLESYRNSYALVMEDFGGVSLRQYAQGQAMRSLPARRDLAGTTSSNAQSLIVTEVLEIALQLADILDGLYHHRVIHKDIKPANILIHPETKQIKLIDFSIASLLPRETQEIQNPNVLEGTLAYISPEQTGRMNRGIDYRTDFYSLGVTLYELLTGQLPFQCDDPMELVHCHIAKQPDRFKIENSKFKNEESVPPVIADIVMKLMAKNAEDRYQSALGLKHDLEWCLQQWQDSGRIETFRIGQRDICDRFLIPEKLYGRQLEVETLLTAFDRISQGSCEIMLVAGFSGIGKTAVVNEIHKPIVRQRGYFIKGKFDQFQRNIPFSAFLQAFRDLMGQLLSETDAQLEEWKSKILSALGENGQVITQVIPELEQIIGQQPPVSELSGNAAQNRFNLLFQKFIQVFTTPDHPLVIFLDDLQWADSASLKLMQVLMSDTKTGYLLLIGAYRDNEVAPAHLLMLTLDEINKTDAIVNTITLKPLLQADLNDLVAEALSCTKDLAAPLTKLVYQKTKGNPFFAAQFLKALHEEGWIIFNSDLGYWQCNIAQIRALALTDDVVEFMALQLQKLPQATQEVLKLAACIGNQFDLATLAIVQEKSQAQTATDLWKVLQEELVLPTSEVYKFFQADGNDPLVMDDRQDSISSPITYSQLSTYKFLHDRVQQAAYSLIPDEQKQVTHLKIGQLLLSHTPVAEQDEKLFEIVNQLNIGKSLIVEQLQQTELAELNLKAGYKAKAATAYTAAFEYFTIGISLLAEQRWQTQYKLTLALYEAASEAAYLSGNFEQAESLGEVVFKRANTLLEKIKTYETRIQMYAAQNRMQAALDVGLQVLEMLGVSLIQTPPPNLPIEDLYSLPEMTDSYKQAAMRILAQIQPPAYHAQPAILPFVAFTMVHLTIENGNSAPATYGYVFYGLILCLMSDFELGYQYGQLALRMLDQFDTRDIKTKVYNVFNCFIRHWKEHTRETLQLFGETVQIGLETGDLEYVSYASFNYCHNLFLVGEPLDNVNQQVEHYIALLRKIKQEFQLQATQIWGQLVLNLKGEALDRQQLIGDRFDETTILLNPGQTNWMSMFCAYFAKSFLCYLFEDYAAACEFAAETEKYAPAMAVLFPVSQNPFYYSLALLAQCSLNIAETEIEVCLKTVDANQQKMQIWAEHAPMNFQHKYDLVEAEKARVLGQRLEAIEYYERAISGASCSGYIQEVAIANELAAKFYLNWNKEKIAQPYMQEAYYGYARWGAKAKVNDLEKRYPQLLKPILQQREINLNPLETIATLRLNSVSLSTHTSTSTTSISHVLDFASVLKAAQAISSSIEFDELIASLTRILLENSGAEKSVLILPQKDTWQVRAITSIHHEENSLTQIQTMLDTQPVDTCQDIPQNLIYYVKNTRQRIVIDNLQTDIPGLMGEYMLTHQPQSVFCLPILNQKNLVGIIYLENKLTKGVFTNERLQVINLLASQVAISLENAHLYQQAQTALQESQQTQQLLRQVIDNIPQIVFWKDRNSVYLGCNNNFAQTANISSPEDIVGKTDYDLPWTEAEANWYRECDRRIMDANQPELHIIETVQQADGKTLWVDTSKIPLGDANGNVFGILGTTEDITERKRAEAVLQQRTIELEHALSELQRTQVQLIQNEKMSALGNLVAGVAHEINNPVGFIAGNLDPAKDYIQDLLGLIELYQQKLPHPDAEIEEEIESIDLEYLREDLPKLIESMQLGVERIRNISTSLRTFSRADKDYKVPFNIHEGIDSTILILKHRLKANDDRPAIEVVKEFGNLPAVECFPGQLNQVFMNILANAIDALEESNQGRSFAEIQAHPNRIIIRTEMQENEWVTIRIIDNGIGMTEDVKRRIFDHLFTTKSVGQGTGLGLAIARQIVEEKHNGQLWCSSTPGQGTQFAIAFPSRQNS